MCVCVCVYIYIYIYIHLFINLFHVGIVKISQKCDEAKVKQWIKKVLKGTPDRQGGPSKKAKQEIETKLETLFLLWRFLFLLGANRY